MKLKTKSVIISVLLYILLALMWCGIAYVYSILFVLDDIMNYVWDGLLENLFVIVSFICVLIPIIFRKKLKLRLPLLLVIFTVISLITNIGVHIATTSYFSHYSKQKWSDNRELRYYMINDIEKTYGIAGKTEQEVIELLGEPEFKTEGERFQYYTGHYMIDPYTYDIIFEDGIAVGTEEKKN